MFDQRIRNVMDRKKLLKVPPETSVREAAKLMTRRKAGAVLIVRGKRLIGIFTERDAVFRVMARGLDAEATQLAEVMTRDPQTLTPEERFGHALLVMHENGFRHIPVVENGEPVGMVTSRMALDPDMEDFISEAQRRKHIRRQVGERVSR